MSGWILVACCAGLVGIGLYLLLTAPPVGPYDLTPRCRCSEDCEGCEGQR